MYSVCKTGLPPTTVEHSIHCHFYNKSESNLIVAGANRITVYRIVRFIDTKHQQKQKPKDDENKQQIKQENGSQSASESLLNNDASPKQQQKIKLECLQTFELFGTIASLQKVTLGNKHTAKRDSLVVSFHDAKLSILEYDPNTHDLKTLSMHYFEDDLLRDGYVTNHMFPPIVRMDPEDRCAAMLVYGRHIIIVPLNRDNTEDMDQTDRINASNMSFDDPSFAVPNVNSRPQSPIPFINNVNPLQEKQALVLPSVVTPSYRSPVLPSYKIDLSEETCGEKIDNIVDIQFLFNYNSPTLVILYEPVRTWSGRIATRQDTFSMVVLSMNTQQQMQHIIWPVKNLPYDCQLILPVPKPIGGLLIIAVNELIFLNQSVPPYGVNFNCFTKESSDYPLNDQEAPGTDNLINISLDLAKAQFLTSNKILFVLKGGEIYLVTLFNDDMRCIKNFKFEKLATTVHPSTLTLCEGNLVFVGSHVGNSVLLEYIEKEIFDDDINNDQLSYMKLSRSIKSFIYTHDSLISTSASGRICYGEAPKISETFSQDAKTPFVELVTTAGYDKNGSVCVLQQTIKPEIQDTFDLRDCDDLWTVKSYMIISRSTSTRIFAISEDFRELSQEECDFELGAPTVCADVIDNLIVQINECGVLILDNLKLIEKITLPGDIYDANVSDGNIVALSKENSLYYIEIQIQHEASQTKVNYLLKEIKKSNVVALSIYKDIGGFMNNENQLNKVSDAPEINFDTLGANKSDEDEIFFSDRFSPDKQEFVKENPSKLNKISEIVAGNLDDDDDIYGADDCDMEFESALLAPSKQPVDIKAEKETICEVPIIVKIEPIDQVDRVEPFNIIDEKSPIKTDSEDDDKIDDHNDDYDVIVRDDLEENGNMHDDAGSIDIKELKKAKIEALKKENQETEEKVEVENENENGYEEESEFEDETVEVDLSAELNDTSRYQRIIELKKYTPTYWLFLVDDRGVLEVYSLPNFELVYLCKNLPMSPKILLNNVQYFYSDAEIDSRFPKTKEILVQGLGLNGHRPFIFVRFDDELVCYEAYNYDEVIIENHLNIRFAKVDSILLSTIIPTEANSQEENPKPIEHEPETKAQKSSRSSKHHSHQQQQALLKEKFQERRHWLKSFTNLSNRYSGVFLMGQRPYWLIMSHYGVLRSHSMPIEGPIYCFTACKLDVAGTKEQENGFIYYTENRELRIARLPKHMNLDFEMPIRKINVGGTPHFVTYHVDRKLYCVVSSNPKSCWKMMKVGSEPDTMKTEMIEKSRGYIPPKTESFKLQLYDPDDWEQVPDGGIEFDEWEHVTCIKNVMLASEGTTSGLKSYLAISTNYCYGEDVPNRGRIWILDLIEVVPEPGRPLTKNKMKTVYCQEQKGPVTTLSHTCGLLMSAVGQKIYLWQLKEGELVGIAFIDTQIYIHCASSIKNLILVSDICKSVSLLRYQQGTKTLSMVCRDTKPLEVYSCDFTIDNELLNFVVTDSEKNIIIYAYEPEHRDSHGGTRLLRRADYHLGAHINSLCRIKARVPLAYEADPVESVHFKRRHVTMYLTIEGSLGFLMPIDEIVFRRLQMLQNEMTIALSHIAGLNPKAWRLVKHYRKSLFNPCKLILDVDFLQTFMHLSQIERLEITRKIGTTVDKILADLQHIYDATLNF